MLAGWRSSSPAAISPAISPPAIGGAFLGKIFLVTVHLGLSIDNALAVQVVSAAVGALAMIALTRMVAGA